VDDLVTACVAALERPVSGVFNVGDGDHSSTTTFLQVTAELAGLPPPELVTLTEARGRVSPGMLAYLVESRRVATGRMRDELGVTPRFTTVAAGVAASLAEMRAQGH
jgi:nucleoside-diphosphate-sugar epimerase